VVDRSAGAGLIDVCPAGMNRCLFFPNAGQMHLLSALDIVLSCQIHGRAVHLRSAKLISEQVFRRRSFRQAVCVRKIVEDDKKRRYA
jgi:hypothetical protein